MPLVAKLVKNLINSMNTLWSFFAQGIEVREQTDKIAAHRGYTVQCKTRQSQQAYRQNIFLEYIDRNKCYSSLSLDS